MNEYEIEKQKQELKNNRVKEVKWIKNQLRKKENAYRKDMINIYKNKQDEIDQEKINEQIVLFIFYIAPSL